MSPRSTGVELPVRERILVATLEVIATDGVDAVRHRRVADLAGVSPGSTTYHFESREELVEEAFGYYLDQATAVLDQLAPPAAGVDAPADALLAYIGELLDLEFGSRGLVQAEYELILHSTRSPVLARRLAEWEDARAEQLAGFLGATGAPRAEEMAQVLVVLIRGLELERLIHPERRNDPGPRLAPLVEAIWASD